jgi:AcrR family transcriptional regulator
MNLKEPILTKAILLFAEKGFAGLSMRQLAKEVGISAATIYHHFPDKQSLYRETVLFAFSDKEQAFTKLWSSDGSAEQKLSDFIRTTAQLLIKDRDFNRLLQREILEANPDRMRLLAQTVFKKQFDFLLQLAAELAPKRDVHLTAISIVSLVKHHLEMQPLCRQLPGWKPEHETAEILAAHVSDLLLMGLKV